VTVSTVGWAIVAAANALAAAWGADAWWRVRTSRTFWPLLRVAQALVLVQLVAIGIVLLTGRRPADDLYYLYSGLPVLVAFFAEQLRVIAARTVLDRRGLQDGRAVGRLPEAEQRSVVLEIVRREVGVMAVSAAAVMGLAVRAATLWH
jgi:hypothetical protein